MNVHRKRVFAVALAVAVAGTSFNVAGLAVNAGVSKNGRVITEFERLPDEIAYQYLPVGSSEADINFPDEMTVYVYSDSETEEETPSEPDEGREEKDQDAGDREQPGDQGESGTGDQPGENGRDETGTPDGSEAPVETGDPAEIPEQGGEGNDNQPGTEQPENGAPDGNGGETGGNDGNGGEPAGETGGNDGSSGESAGESGGETGGDSAGESGGEEQPESGGEAETVGALKSFFGVVNVYAAEQPEEGGEGGDDGQEEKDSPKEEEEEGSKEETPQEETPQEGTPEEGSPQEGTPEEGSQESGDQEGGSGENTDGDTVSSPDSVDGGSEEGGSQDGESEEPQKLAKGEQKLLTGLSWKLVRDESAYSRFQAVLEGDVFVYEPDLSYYALKTEAALPQIRVTVTAKEESVSGNTVSEDTVSENTVSENVAFRQMMVIGGVQISVEAPAGVFPEDAVLKVKKIDDEGSLSKMEETIREDMGISEETEGEEPEGEEPEGEEDLGDNGLELLSFDITITDPEGNELQPDTECGEVKVTFANAPLVEEAIADENAELAVYHFEDDSYSSAEKLDTEVNEAEGTASVEGEHFSAYVIVKREANGLLSQWVQGEWLQIRGAGGARLKVGDSVFVKIPRDLISTTYISHRPYKCQITWTDEAGEPIAHTDNLNMDDASSWVVRHCARGTARIRLWAGTDDPDSTANDDYYEVTVKVDDPITTGQYVFSLDNYLNLDRDYGKTTTEPIYDDAKNKNLKTDLYVYMPKVWYYKEGTRDDVVIGTEDSHLRITLVDENSVSGNYIYTGVDESGLQKDADGEYVVPSSGLTPADPDPKNWQSSGILTDRYAEAGFYIIGLSFTIDPVKYINDKVHVEGCYGGTPQDKENPEYRWDKASGETYYVPKLVSNSQQYKPFRIRKLPIRDAVSNKAIKVTEGGDYLTTGYEVFSVQDNTAYPGLRNDQAGIVYKLKTPNGNPEDSDLQTNSIAAVDQKRAYGPGKFDWEIDARNAKNYKGAVTGSFETKTVSVSSSSISANIYYNPLNISDKSAFTDGETKFLKTVRERQYVLVKKNLSGNEADVLTEGTDYDLTYNCLDPITTNGTKVEAIITGKGAYTGQVKAKMIDDPTQEFFNVTYSPYTILYNGEETRKDWYSAPVKLSAKDESGILQPVSLSENNSSGATEVTYDKEGKNQALRLTVGDTSNPIDFPVYLSIDKTAPDGTISVVLGQTTKTYKGLDADGTIDLYAGDKVQITASAEDKLSGVAAMAYYVAVGEDKGGMKKEDLEKVSAGSWKNYTAGSSIPLSQSGYNFVYLRIKDVAGNVGYAATNGICFDKEPPTIDSLEYSRDTNKMVTVKMTASDKLSGVDKYYAYVLPVGTDAPLVEAIMKNGQVSDTDTFTLTKAVEKSSVLYAVVTDKVGNVSKVSKVDIKVKEDPVDPPTGKITVEKHSYSTMQGKDVIDDYYKEQKGISISASGKAAIKSIQYYITDKFYSSSTELEGEVTGTKTTTKDGVTTTTTINKWSNYNNSSKPYLLKNKLNYIYAKVSDNGGNVIYLSSHALWEDEILPKVSSVAGTPKDTTCEVTVKGTDGESGVKYYYVKGMKKGETAPKPEDVKGGERSEDGKFNLTGLTASTDYDLYAVIEDKAGNLSECQKTSIKTKETSSSAGKSEGAAGKGGAGAGAGSGSNGGKSGATDKKSEAGAGAGEGEEGNPYADLSLPNGIPYIEDASAGIAIGQAQTSGWDKIGEEAAAAADTSEIHVAMNGATVVPTSILSQLKERNITYYFNMPDDMVWAVNGLSFTGDVTSDVDFRIRKDTRNIPIQLINDVAGVYPHTNLTLSHDGDFGFTAILSLPFDADNAGMYANLYHYNESAGKLEFMESGEVRNNGRAEFKLTHASDYTVILRGDALTDKTAAALMNEFSGADSDDIIRPLSGSASFFSRNSRNLWVLLITLMSLMLCGFILFLPEDQRRRRRV